MRRSIEDRFERNLARVQNLLTLYAVLRDPVQGRKAVHYSDVLRAATVLLHAALEDAVRSIQAWRLPGANEQAFASIPLAGSSGKLEKFTLAEVAAHRGKSVQELLQASVSEHLERRSYPDSTTVVASLSAVGVDPATLKPFLSAISELIERRHSIVHRADRNEKSGRGQYPARSIGEHHVQRWLEAVRGLMDAAFRQL